MNGRDNLLRQLLRFTKIEHTMFSLPLLLAGAWLGAGRRLPTLRVMGLVLLAGIGARVLGMSMNRILDRKLDALNPRTASRELPAGRMKLRTAVAAAASAGLVYLGACVLLGPLVAVLSPVPLAALLGYSLLKRVTPLCHFGIGLCLGLAPICAFVAASGNLDMSAEIILLALYAFCWMSGFDIIYGLQDIESDRRTGVHSIPAAIGPARAQAVAMAVHGVAVASMVTLLIRAGGGLLPVAALSVAACAFACAYLPIIPLHSRFFPISAVAGVAGAFVPLLSGGPPVL